MVSSSAIMKIKTRTEQVVDQIATAIVSGKFKPGSQLKSRVISEWLGVSVTPVREAFKILESVGYVRGSSNRGVQIPVITTRELEEIAELRLLLEMFYIEKFIERSESADINAMAGIIARMQAATNQENYIDYFNASFEFHAYFIRQCRNKKSYDAFLVIRNILRCAQLLWRGNLKIYEKSIKEHKEILLAIGDKDPKRCKKLLREHLENTFCRQCEAMRQL